MKYVSLSLSLFVCICITMYAIQKTAAGLLLPSASAERGRDEPVFARVLSLSDEVLAAEKKAPSGLAEGVTVVFDGYAGSEVEFGDKDYLFVRASEILGVLGE